MSKEERPIIAVIGSANGKRNLRNHKWPYKPPLEHADIALGACEEIGHELALAGWDVMVYAGAGIYNEEEGFVEPAVVKGYLSKSEPRPSSIRVFYSRAFAKPTFEGEVEHPDAFEFRADLSDFWEPSFFRSLADVDAALIVGGGHSAYMAGLVCMGRKIPVLALGTFGAAGARVFDAVVQARTPLRESDLELLGQPDWTASSAHAVVASLKTQSAALDEERVELQQRRISRRRSQNAAVALVLFIAASLLVPTALVIDEPRNWLELALLFIAPLVAGASGGTIRSLLPRTHEIEISTIGSAALGAVAGGVTGLAYLTAQLTSSSDTTLGALTDRQYQTFVLFSVVIGFIAGLALDSVYQRLITAGAASARDL